MNSYDDMPDAPNGCLRPTIIIAAVAVLYLLFGCTGCAGGPPTFTAAITNPDGKKIAHVQGAVDDNKPWLERYAGPLGAFLSGVGWIFLPAAPVTP